MMTNDTHAVVLAIDQGGKGNHGMITEQLGKWHYTSCCCDLYIIFS